MPTIRENDAREKLAEATERASAEDLADIHKELFPRKARPQAAEAIALLSEITTYIRTKMELDELIDLWNFVFSRTPVAFYNEIDEVIEYKVKNPLYAEW